MKKSVSSGLTIAVVALLVFALGACEDLLGSDDEGNGDGNGGGGTFDTSDYPVLTGSPTYEVNGDSAATEASPGDTVTMIIPVSFPTGYNDGTTANQFYWDPEFSGTTNADGFATATLTSSGLSVDTTIQNTGVLGSHYPLVYINDLNTNVLGYALADDGSGNLQVTYYERVGGEGGSLFGNHTEVSTFAAIALTIVAAQTTISSDFAAGTPIDVGDSDSHTIVADDTGYLRIDLLNLSTPYGVYVTDSTTTSGDSPLAINVDYVNSGSLVIKNDEGATTGSTVTTGFISNAVAGFDEVVEVDNTSSTDDIDFDIEVVAALAGGSAPGSPVALSLDTATVVGPTFNNGCFEFQVAGGETTARLEFVDLTIRIDVTIYDTDDSTTLTSFSSSATTNRSETFDITGLTGGAFHSFCGDSQAVLTNVPAVGTLTITSPTP